MHNALFFFTSVGVYCNSLCASCDENKLVLYKRLTACELVQKEAAASVVAKTVNIPAPS